MLQLLNSKSNLPSLIGIWSCDLHKNHVEIVCKNNGQNSQRITEPTPSLSETDHTTNNQSHEDPLKDSNF